MSRFLAFLNHLFGVIGSFFQSPLLLALRLFFGISFIFSGFSKFQDISKFSDTLMTLHVPYPDAVAWAVAFTETIGGLCLALGFLSRIVSIPLIAVMCGAYATAHAESLHPILQNPKNIIDQPPFNFLLTSLLVFAFGPGIFSLDALLNRKAKKEEQTLAK